MVPKGGYDDAARAAIETMREPTEEMIGEAREASFCFNDAGNITQLYQAMISAALEQEGKGE